MSISEPTLKPKFRFGRFQIIWLVVLGIGFGLRLWGFPYFPAGLHQDEISASYEAWSLLTTGHDRWGYPLPAYFISWGSGQNVLYTYLTLPVMMLFGQTTFTIRFVAMLIGLLTLPLVYLVAKELYGRTVALISMLVAGCAPYLIAVSHVGIESNIAPFFALLGIYLILLGLRTGYKRYIVPALIPLAVCLYAYILTLIPLLVMLLVALIIYRKRVRAHVKAWILAAIIFVIIAAPLLLFLFKNFVVHHSIGVEKWLPFSIPLLTGSRLNEVSKFAMHASGIFDNPPGTNFFFLINGLNDGYPVNTTVGFTPVPVLVLVMFVVLLGVTVYRLIRHRGVHPNILHASVIGIIPLLLVTYMSTNVTRMNVVFVPLIIITVAFGFGLFQRIRQQWLRIVLIPFILFFGLAPGSQVAYHGVGQADTDSTFFNPHLGAVLNETIKLADGKPIALSERINGNYMYILWDEKIPPAVFADSGAKPTDPHFQNFYFTPPSRDKLQDFYFIAPILYNDLPYCSKSELKIFHPMDGYFIGHCVRS